MWIVQYNGQIIKKRTKKCLTSANACDILYLSKKQNRIDKGVNGSEETIGAFVLLRRNRS